MREYLNNAEKELHIKIIACQGELQDFVACKILNKEERKYLRYAQTYLNKFNESIFDRFGEDHKRRLLNTLKCNRLRFVGECEPVKDTVRKLDEEKLLPLARDMQLRHCLFCEKENYKECEVCQFCEELWLEGSNPEGGCPYKL